MGPTEDVFRFVAMRDPEPRRGGARGLTALAYDPAGPTSLHLRLVRAADRKERAEAAAEYLRAPFNTRMAKGGDRREVPRFIGGRSAVPRLIRDLDDLLTESGDRISGKRIVTRMRTELTAVLPDPPKEEPSLRELLNNPYVHGLWLDHADSMLAVYLRRRTARGHTRVVTPTASCMGAAQPAQRPA